MTILEDLPPQSVQRAIRAQRFGPTDPPPDSARRDAAAAGLAIAVVIGLGALASLDLTRSDVRVAVTFVLIVAVLAIAGLIGLRWAGLGR